MSSFGLPMRSEQRTPAGSAQSGCKACTANTPSGSPPMRNVPSAAVRTAWPGTWP